MSSYNPNFKRNNDNPTAILIGIVIFMVGILLSARACSQHTSNFILDTPAELWVSDLENPARYDHFDDGKKFGIRIDETEPNGFLMFCSTKTSTERDTVWMAVCPTYRGGFEKSSLNHAIELTGPDKALVYHDGEWRMYNTLIDPEFRKNPDEVCRRVRNIINVKNTTLK